MLFGFGICLFVFLFFFIRFNICFSLLLNQWDCRNICQIELSTKPFLSMTCNFSHCTLLQLSKYRIGYQCTASVFASQKQMPEYTEWIVCIVFSSRAQWLNPELQTIGTNEPQHTNCYSDEPCCKYLEAILPLDKTKVYMKKRKRKNTHS